MAESAYVATIAFENGGLTSWRSRVWRGGSVSSIVLRASIASGASSSISVPPTSDEYVRQSLCTATSSSQRVTAQKPAPVWPLAAVSLIHATGASRRNRSYPSCGTPSAYTSWETMSTPGTESGRRTGPVMRDVIARCRRGTGRACGGG